MANRCSLLYVLPWFLLSFDAAVSDEIQLSKNCPPSFERHEDGTCRLVTLYDRYDSLQGKGVGGTQTALPARRDGFSAEQIDLGRYLFFDPLLSVDQTVSCASCHQPARGFSDGLGQSIGVNNQTTHRSAPTLWNSAFLQRLFWDARANSLESQAAGPLYADNEMGNTPKQLLQRLNQNMVYVRLFRDAFPSTTQINVSQIYAALAAFESSLISLNSRYDQYAHGYHQALNSEEIAGLNVFRSFVARCAECHTPPLFTNQQIAVIGTPEPTGMPRDIGAEATFGSAKLRGGFKVPTLRNIEQTAPYMHSGRFKSLREAVAFYNDGRGHAVPNDEVQNIHWHIWEPNLADEELDLLVAFLKTLTDEAFMPAIPTRLPSGLSAAIQTSTSSAQDVMLTPTKRPGA